MPERFPKPWKARELQESFVIEDASNFPLAYVYFADRPQDPMTPNPRMTREQARKIAKAFAKVGQ